MSRPLRLAVALYLGVLTVAAIVGDWPLQGPSILALTSSHGIHIGDVGVLVASAIAAAALLRSR